MDKDRKRPKHKETADNKHWSAGFFPINMITCSCFITSGRGNRLKRGGELFIHTNYIRPINPHKKQRIKGDRNGKQMTCEVKGDADDLWGNLKELEKRQNTGDVDFKATVSKFPLRTEKELRRRPPGMCEHTIAQRQLSHQKKKKNACKLTA